MFETFLVIIILTLLFAIGICILLMIRNDIFCTKVRVLEKAIDLYNKDHMWRISYSVIKEDEKSIFVLFKGYRFLIKDDENYKKIEPYINDAIDELEFDKKGIK